MKKKILLIMLLCIFLGSNVWAANADFSWTPNSETNLAGYKIYYSTIGGQYVQFIDVGNPGVINNTVQATVNGLADGTTYYFVATAYDTDGFESDYSQEVVWTSPEAPIIEGPPVDEPPGTVIGVTAE